MVEIGIAQENVQVVADVVLMMRIMMEMTGLSGSATTSGGGSCGFEKDGLVPIVTAATALTSPASSSASSAAIVASFFSDRFHFTYFNA